MMHTSYFIQVCIICVCVCIYIYIKHTPIGIHHTSKEQGRYAYMIDFRGAHESRPHVSLEPSGQPCQFCFCVGPPMRILSWRAESRERVIVEPCIRKLLVYVCVCVCVSVIVYVYI